MGNPRITYNGKTIDLPHKPLWRHVEPHLPRTINRTLSGAVETLLSPRINIQIRTSIEAIDDADLLRACQNWWQWVQQGGDSKLAFDSDRLVETTLGTTESAGATTLRLMSASGITTGYYYGVVDGPNFEVVNVTAVAGTGITISSALDKSFSGGALFRDEYYFNIVVLDSNVRTPIEFLRGPEQTFPPKRFTLNLDLVEATT